MRLFLLVWMLVAGGCLSKSIQDKQATSQVNILQFEALKHLLGKELSLVKNTTYSPDVVVSDTTFESEDGENWPGFVFYNESERIFFIETSWQKKQTISRVVVVNNSIPSSSGITVGSKFKDIREKLSKTIPSYPDGYLGLQDITDSGVVYFFDVDTNPKVSLGNVTFDTIPEDLVVTQILIESRP